MTPQIPDSCFFNWCRWEADTECNKALKDIIPTCETLGFKTDTKTTANWSGRVDHFLVYNDSIYLHKIEVNLGKDSLGFIPKNAAKEIITTYEPVTMFGDPKRFNIHNVGKQSYQKHEYVYFVFGGGDFKLAYTGELTLLFPYIDYWEIPATEDYPDPEFTKRAVLTFEEGILVEQNVEDIN